MAALSLGSLSLWSTRRILALLRPDLGYGSPHVSQLFFSIQCLVLVLLSNDDAVGVLPRDGVQSAHSLRMDMVHPGAGEPHSASKLFLRLGRDVTPVAVEFL